MSVFSDIGDRLLSLSKTLALIDERFKRQEEDLRTLQTENAKLRDDLAVLTTRVAVLEEGRNAIDDRVERKMTEVIARWQQQSFENERRRLEDENARLRQGIEAKPQ